MADAPRRESVPGLPTTPYEPASEPPLLDTAAELVPQQDDIPTFAGRFRIDGEIARGGIGIVLRAFDPLMQRPVAVKVLQQRFRGNLSAEARFHAEARLTGQLQHPGIPPAFEVGQLADGSPFFALKLIEGRTLQAVLAGRPASPEELAGHLALFEQVCRAVAFAHGKGVLHRDLKPGNVMVGAFGEVQVMDWGLAKILGQAEAESTGQAAARTGLPEGSTEPGAVLGTPATMAPEQARGEIDRLDRRCDVFGLGAILGALLTGRPPFAGPQARELARRGDVSAAFARLEGSGTDPVLVGLAKACLAPEPADRPADAGAVAERVAAYRAAVEEERRRAERDRAAAEVRRAEAKRRRRWQQALAGSIFFLILAAALVLGWQQTQNDRSVERARWEVAVREGLGDVLQARNIAAGQVEDLRGWREAAHLLRQSWQRVDELTAAGEASPEIREQIEEERQALRALEQDHSRRVELDRIWQRLREGRGDEQARRRAAREYAAVYGACGIDVLDPNEAAARIDAHRLRVGLASFLDVWQAVAGDADESRRLRRLISARANQEPAPARQLRRCVATRGEEMDDLFEQCRELPELKTFVLNQARLLLLGEGDGTEVLKGLLAKYPEDYWINFELGACNLEPQRRDEELPSSPELDQPGDVLAEDESEERAPAEVKRFRKLLELTPDYARAHYWLGRAHRLAREEGQAIASLRQATTLDPSDAAAHAELGEYLLLLGRPGPAVPALRRSCQLVSEGDPRRPELEEALARASREARLESRLLLFLQGRARPTDPAEQVGLAELARKPAIRRYRTALALYTDAFAARPGLAEDSKAGHRMMAIRCALCAADDRGDEQKTTETERLRLWHLARAWLREEYAARGRLWKGKPAARQILGHHVATWTSQLDMRSVFLIDASSRLPTAEREAWRKLWHELGVPTSTSISLEPAFARQRQGVEEDVRNQRWQKAASGFAGLVGMPSGRLSDHVGWSRASLLAGDRKEFIKASALLLARFGDTHNPEQAADILSALVLGPLPSSHHDRLLDLAQAARKHKDGSRLAAATLYRVGRFKDALGQFQSLHQGERGVPRGGDLLFVAMAQKQAGQPEEAAASLGRARRWIEQAGQGKAAPTGVAWATILEEHEVKVLLREAVSLIEGKGAPPPGPSP